MDSTPQCGIGEDENEGYEKLRDETSLQGSGCCVSEVLLSG